MEQPSVDEDTHPGVDLLARYPWLCNQKINTVKDRLKVVKAAWVAGGGSLPQEWFDQNGSKNDILARLDKGLSLFSPESVALASGLSDAVMAERFSFAECMRQFSLDWGDTLLKIKEACREAFTATMKARRLQEYEQVAETETESFEVVPTDKVGPNSNVLLAPFACSVPLGLLPEGTKTKVLPQNYSEPHSLPASCCDQIVGEAKARGLKPRSTWKGLGKVPSGIPKSFRSVLFCGDSGSGKTTALRNFLRERYGGMETCEGSLVQVQRVDGDFEFGAGGAGVVIKTIKRDPEQRDFLRVRLENGQTLDICGKQLALSVAPDFGLATWGHDSLLRAFGESKDEVQAGVDALTSVGFSSVPSWFKPFDVLSRGEKYRANLAMLFHRRNRMRAGARQVPVVLDEFTSELDRPVAKMMSMALRKRMCSETGDTDLVLATCNADIIPYLAPEWLVVCRSGQMPILLPGPSNPSRIEVIAELHTKLEQHCGPTGQWLVDGEEEPFKIRRTKFNRNGRAFHVPGEFTIEVVGMGDGVRLQREAEVGKSSSSSTKKKKEQSMTKGKLMNTTAAADLQTDHPWLCKQPITLLAQRLKVFKAAWVAAGGSAPQCWFSQKGSKSELLERIAMSISCFTLGNIKPSSGLRQAALAENFSFNSCMKRFALSWDATLAASKKVSMEISELDYVPGEWLVATFRDEVVFDMRIREVDVDEHGSAMHLEVQCKSDSKLGWGVTRRAYRMARIASRIDNDLFKGECLTKAGLSYNDKEVDLLGLHARNWFVPRHLDPGRFGGLKVLREHDISEPFTLKPMLPSGRTLLASYVGDARGQLAPGLEDAEALFDCTFDGFVCHTIPDLKLKHILQGGSKQRPLKEYSNCSDGLTTVGVVFGPSGSGKSTLVRHCLAKPFQPVWCNGISVLEHFPSLALAEELFHATHLPLETSMVPYTHLSRGEQSRADLARILAHGVQDSANIDDALIVEEFTSLLDRATAKELSSRLQLFLRSRRLPPIVLVSCHEDFVGAGLLEPNWVFDTRSSRLSLLQSTEHSPEGSTSRESPTSRPEKFRKRPAGAGLGGSAKRARKDPDCPWVSALQSLSSVHLQVRRALPCEWQHFRQFHYKDHNLQGSALCWVGSLDGTPIAMTAAFPFAPNFPALLRDQGHPNFAAYPISWTRRTLFREHRTVVLPDYQGTGVGSAMSDAVARDLELSGYAFTSQTVHPFFGSYRERSAFWKPCSSNREMDQLGRPKYSHYWIGAVGPDGLENKSSRSKLARRVQLLRGQEV